MEFKDFIDNKTIERINNALQKQKLAVYCHLRNAEE